MHKPHIVADVYIPFLQGLLEDVATVSYITPEEFTPESIQDADALLIRTRTKCNEALLKGSKVQFIATTTIGFDHIDIDYCQQNGITWTNSAGCNANSVANYIYSALLFAFSKEELKGKTLGIIGVGNIGKKVINVGKKLGMKVLLNDPPRAEKEGPDGFSSLDEIAANADVITLHTPLNESSYHIVSEDFLKKCQKTPLIINAARGPVADNIALLNYPGRVIVDCWEGEPNLNRDLLKKAIIGTAHIAGYSLDGKAIGTEMVAKAFCQHFNIDKEIKVKMEENPHIPYDIEKESLFLKNNPDQFEYFRNNYPVRRDNYDF